MSMNKNEAQNEDIPDEDQETSSIEKPLTVIQNEQDDKRKLIVVLEKAYLESAKIKGRLELLTGDDHKHYISRKLNRDYSVYRPDITHQCLLALMDSPLNKAGKLEVYIHTEKNMLIHINPSTKLPRTYRRFCKLMAQLLVKLKIRAANSSEVLLKIVKNPITAHLPHNTLKIGTSVKARVIKLKEFLPKIDRNGPICVVIGAVSKGDPSLECDYLDDTICISRYGLSAACVCSKFVNEFEDLWNVF